MNVLIQILFALFVFIQLIVGLYVLTPFISLLLFGFVRLFNIRTGFHRKPVVSDRNFDFAIIITAHQETEFISPLVDSLLKQSYGQFQIYVVADQCDVSSLSFSDSRVSILLPERPLNAKIRSIQYAIDRFQRPPDALVIFDSDNLVHPRFMSVMNDHFRKGYRVVQGDFQPKNTDSHFARMDAIGDMVNFFIDREVRTAVGLSANIWGSGVAFDFGLYQDIQYRDMLGGFDKKLQAHLVLQVKRIAFTKEAILYDEKIDSGASLETQRARWIHAYFKYFRESGVIFVTGIRRFDFNLFYYGFVLLRPPLFMVMGAAGLLALLDFFIVPVLFWVWIGIFLSFLVSFFIIVIIKSRDKRFLGTLLMLPLFVLRQVGAVMKIGKAKKSFLKTRHTKLFYIEDMLPGGKGKSNHS